MVRWYFDEYDDCTDCMYYEYKLEYCVRLTKTVSYIWEHIGDVLEEHMYCDELEAYKNNQLSAQERINAILRALINYFEWYQQNLVDDNCPTPCTEIEGGECPNDIRYCEEDIMDMLSYRCCDYEMKCVSDCVEIKYEN